MQLQELRWKKYPVLNDGFICLVDHMGDDRRIVNAARTSYGKDERLSPNNHYEYMAEASTLSKDRGLIRRLMMDGHTSPFEKVKFEFLVRVPMDCWRQWIRHRTADVNEYSTRYSEAIDSQQVTLPGEWRLQAKDNKQGSSGFLEEWPEGYDEYTKASFKSPGGQLSAMEEIFLEQATQLYQQRLEFGIAREQARKDLPLSTYTEAYWGCSLHNIFNFLRLRMDSHAQLEIRLYANAMYEIIKQVCPVSCEAFEDYVLNAKKFSRMEMELIQQLLTTDTDGFLCCADEEREDYVRVGKPSNMTDNEWSLFLKKLS